MQSIMIATTNTQKKPTPTFNSLTSKTLLKSNYIKSYTSIFQKTWKDYTNISCIVQIVQISRY